MESDANRKCESNQQLPSLEVLINAIDRQVEQLPSPYADEKFAASLSDGADASKKQGRQYIRFTLESTLFALPLQNSLEIDYVPEITPLPNLPQWVLGICNLRGDIISVIDLKLILDLRSQGSEPARKLLLIRNKDFSTAILVYDVAGVRYSDDQDSPKNKEELHRTKLSKFVSRMIEVDGQPVHLLDVDKLMTAIML